MRWLHATKVNVVLRTITHIQIYRILIMYSYAMHTTDKNIDEMYLH